MCAADLSSVVPAKRFQPACLPAGAEHAEVAEKIRGEEETAFEGDYMD
jgi:hypothetical protein